MTGALAQFRRRLVIREHREHLLESRCTGQVLVDAADLQGIVTADIDVAQARDKDREQGAFALAIMADRRPDLYRI